MPGMKRSGPLLTALVLLCSACSGERDGSPGAPDAAAVGGVIVQAEAFNVKMPVGMVMEHVITPAAFGVWGAVGYELDSRGSRDLTPQTDAQWEAVVNHAATLQESMNLLLLPGRVPDESWPGYVSAVGAVAERLVGAAEARDEKALAQAGDDLVVACEACHSAYQLPAKYQRPAEHQ